MTKRAFDGIMAGLKDALAFVQGDQSAVARTVTVQTTIETESKKLKLDSRLRGNDEDEK